MPDHSSWLSVLNSGRWFSQLPPPLTQGLLGMARLRTLDNGEALFLPIG